MTILNLRALKRHKCRAPFASENLTCHAKAFVHVSWLMLCFRIQSVSRAQASPSLRLAAAIITAESSPGSGLISKETLPRYENYEDLLAHEKDLQAVVVATPDFWHAPITNACLKAGLHVYCEKMMSNTI